MPLSDTVITALPASSRRSWTITRPPEPVNLPAFTRRLLTIWSIRMASPNAGKGPGGAVNATSTPPLSSRGRWAATVAATTSPRSSPALCRVILPLAMRETSNRSSIRRVMWATWRSIISRAVLKMGSSVRASFMSATELRMGARGLRSSWPSRARK